LNDFLRRNQFSSLLQLGPFYTTEMYEYPNSGTHLDLGVRFFHLVCAVLIYFPSFVKNKSLLC